MSEENASDEQFVPKAQYDEYVALVEESQERSQRLYEENEQLKEALKQIRQGIHKAADGYINGNVPVKVESWRRCRELGMDLLHVPMSGDEVGLILNLDNGKLVGLEVQQSK
jgi:transposase